MSRKVGVAFIAWVAALMLGSSAFGAIISQTYTATGASGGVGEADITVNTTTQVITILLKNNTATVDDIAKGLTGVTFGLTNASHITGYSSLSATVHGDATYKDGFIDCRSKTCQDDPSFHDNGTSQPNPYEWAVLTSGLGSLTTPALMAGGGSWKPGGIVNDSVDGSGGGVFNTQHNDWLLSTTFTFNYTINPSCLTNCQPTGFGDVYLYFNTNGENTKGTPGGGGGGGGSSVPEPTSFVLLGTALTGASALLRKRFKA